MTTKDKEPSFIITAIIPSSDDPTRHLRNKKGEYPSKAHEEGTWEDTFRKIGHQAFGCYVGIDKRSVMPEASTGNVVYKGKPIGVDPLPDSPYQWR